MKSDRPSRQFPGGSDVSTKPGAGDKAPLNPDPGFPVSPGQPVEPDTPQIPAVEDSDKRRKRIEIAAYYNAEKRSFQAGGELDDWLDAEKRDDALNSRHS